MARTRLPHDAKAGPTKPEVRAVTLSKLALQPGDHLVEIGSCTGAVTIEAARRAGRVTALERKPERAETTRKNLTANGIALATSGTAEPTTDGGKSTGDPRPVGDEPPAGDRAAVEVRVSEAPEGVPADADALFLGGSRNYRAVLDRAVETAVDRIVMNVSRLEVAGAATEAFRERGLLEEVVQFQVSHGYELAGATSFDSENPVYMLVGGTDGTVATDGGRP
jgi:cobalt-precorrin-6B (C15)-methyltransferase